jgi:cytochrome c oxidase subunit 2
VTGFSFRLVKASLAALMLALVPAIASAQEAGHAVPGQIGLQPSVTPIMDSIVAFHDGLLMWIISAMVLLVLALLIIVIVRFNQRANPVPSRFTHNTMVEIVWTVLPVLILFVIAIPSFGVLADQQTIPDGERRYLGSEIFGGEVEVPAPSLTVKVTGYQWYWGYEYMDEDVDFVSIMLNEDQRADLKPEQPRLLAVDNELIVPVNTTVRLLITAADVLHAFAVPSFGIKVDAVTGRNNESWFYARETGIYYGQCSELCGKDHAFMPIAVRVVEQEQYDTWLAAAQEGSLANANSTLMASIE